MNGEDEVIQTLRDAIARHDPQSLLQLSERFSTGESVLRLRENLRGFIISPYDYDLIFQWMRHQDATLAKIVSAVVLFTNDIDMQVEIFGNFLGVDIAYFPYHLPYNVSEMEFLIDLPGLPGMGVSHYGRDDIAIDQFLLVLEKLYAKLYPARVPPSFRT